MSCPNCLCSDCLIRRREENKALIDRARRIHVPKPSDGWHLGKHDTHYLTRDGATVAVVYERVGGWSWWNFLTSSPGRDGYPTREAAQAAAEEATK